MQANPYMVRPLEGGHPTPIRHKGGQGEVLEA